MHVFTKGTKDHELMRWLLAAICKKGSSRPNLEQVFIDDKWAVTTDGCRMHRFAPAILAQYMAPGCYKVESNTAKSIILSPIVDPLQFPDYEAVFPKGREFRFCFHTDNARATKRDDILRTAGYVIMDLAHHDQMDGRGINIHFVADAIGNQKETGIHQVSKQSSVSDPIVFENDEQTRQAVIMPVLLK